MGDLLCFRPTDAEQAMEPAEWLELQAEAMRESGATTGAILIVIQDDEVDTGWNGLRSREELLQAAQHLLNEAMGYEEDGDE